MTAASSRKVHIRVDAGVPQGKLEHNWNYFGYDEINYTYVPEGRALLAKFDGLEGKPYHVRTHHLFCTGNCHGFYKWGSTNAYLEDADRTPRYDWTTIDLVLDTLLAHGSKPFVELGFMPQDLAAPACYDPANEIWSSVPALILTGAVTSRSGWDITRRP